MERNTLKKLARLIRYYILVSTTAAGSGHPTTSLSATDVMTVLFFKYLRANIDDPANAANDRVIFSKGHAAPLFYALYAAAGKLTEQDLLKLRTFDSPLEGHPVARFRYTEAATGSLGQGLAVGAGEALALRARISNNPINQLSNKQMNPSVFVLLGDGELAEGSVWEAAAFASYYNVDNIVAIADINGLGQSGETMYGHNLETYAKRFESFGWRVITVEDGHDLMEIDNAFQVALSLPRQPAGSRNGIPKPTIIIARSIKGKGVSFLEGKHGWHGKALSKEELTVALKELGKIDKTVVGAQVAPPEVAKENSEAKLHVVGSPAGLQSLPVYDKPTATRRAFGNALVRLGAADPVMMVLDADVQNSTYTEFFAKAYPERFFQMFIAEQTMVGAALGMSKRGLHPWLSTFACFLTRAFDQIRMAALSQATIKICGSHAGVSIGADGVSQMGLEDLAMFRAVHESTVLYPADAVATERLAEAMSNCQGIVYIRTTRGETPVIYDEKEKFVVGGSKVHYASMHQRVNASAKNTDATDALTPERVTIVAAGITLHEAFKAQKELEEQGIGVRVIDCYSIKPIDTKTLQKAAKETKAVIVVEDHYPEGGLGEAVLSALLPKKVSPFEFIHLAVRKTPRSGKPAELLAHQGIDTAAIVKTVKEVI